MASVPASGGRSRASTRGSTASGEAFAEKSARAVRALHLRRALAGHYGKVLSLSWGSSPSDTRIVSASNDGKVIVWAGTSNNQLEAFNADTRWLMAACLSSEGGGMVACGGLDNVVSMYRLGQPHALGTAAAAATATRRPSKQLRGHDGYISAIRMPDAGTVVTGSGDATVRLWDAARGETTGTFAEHSADVNDVAVCPTNPSVFVSGSCDSSAKLWDARVGGSASASASASPSPSPPDAAAATGTSGARRATTSGGAARRAGAGSVAVVGGGGGKAAVQTFTGHTSDVNAVAWMSNGFVVGTASEDSTCAVHDIRVAGGGPLNTYYQERLLDPASSLAFSASGRLLFAGYADTKVRAWDVLTSGGGAEPASVLEHHRNRVSCLALNPTGQALAVGSWDTGVSIWA